MNLTERDVPEVVRQVWRDNGMPEDQHPRSFVSDASTQYSVLLGREQIGTLEDSSPDMRWHISVAHATHLPEWADLAEIAHTLRPGVPFGIAVPPRSWWINIHDYCLHVWETKDQNLIDQWRAESRGDAPT